MVSAGLKRLGALLALLLATAAAADGTPPLGVRELRFAPGKSAVTVNDAAVRAETHVWRFEARAGQQATIDVSAVEHNAAFQVWRPGAQLPATRDGEITGRTLPGAGDEDDAHHWRGRLPDSGAYLVVVGPTRGNATYKLTLKIQP